jgi:hypothetical protein
MGRFLHAPSGAQRPDLASKAMADVDAAANDEVETLVNTLVPFARRMLEKHGSFPPFGASVDGDGELHMVAADAEAAGAGASAADAARLVEAGLREAAIAGEIRASGVCTDVRIDGPEGEVEAISVALEHIDRDPLRVLVSYEVTPSGEHGFGKPIAAPGETRVFA